MTFEEFISKLKVRLSQPLPGEEAQFKMAPARRLSLKGYYEMKNKDPKHSAVLICLYPQNKSVYTVLILRPSSQGVHSDQVSFPGGAVEMKDNSLEETALREAYEEIGIDIPKINVIGVLSPVYIPVSNYLVQPILAFSNQAPDFNINKSEVIHVIETTVSIFIDDSIKSNFIFKSGAGIEIEAPFYEIAGLKVWGATAMMISELEAIIRELKIYE